MTPRQLNISLSTIGRAINATNVHLAGDKCQASRRRRAGMPGAWFSRYEYALAAFHSTPENRKAICYDAIKALSKNA
jgi:hypothetical protein